MVLLIALTAVGVGYGVWNQSLFILGNVTTGDVSASFLGAFTDDDGKVDDRSLDSADRGDCAVNAGGNSSCDPAEGGPDPKTRTDKDVAGCIAGLLPNGATATITNEGVYPGYFCTAWFGLLNDGSLPIRIANATVNGRPLVPSEATPFDLDGDEHPDVTIRLAGVELCQQVDPSLIVTLQLEQSILSDAPQHSQLAYTVEVQLIQWNQECAPAEPGAK